MSVTALVGAHWIAGTAVRGQGAVFHGVNATFGTSLEPAYADATTTQIDEAVAAATSSGFESVDRATRAMLLEAIAAKIEGLGDALIDRAAAETALPRGRLTGERGRTVGQLRIFAAVVREGSYLDLRIDPALPNRAPLPRADLRRMNRPLGPVAVFGASNFPLAFSVAGGDTAAALAAGCPVVVKGHPAHPGTCELVARAIAQALVAVGVSPGTFSMVHGRSHEVGLSLVTHPRIEAAAFTGSLAGGRALYDAAARRDRPIPVFAEMGSVNPVLVLPGVLDGAKDLAERLVASVGQGVGQFCTNPGVILGLASATFDTFVGRMASAAGDAPAGTMLHAGIQAAFDEGLGERASARMGDKGGAAVHRVTGARFLAEKLWGEEHFGPSTVVVAAANREELEAVIDALPGQLTATIHAGPDDLETYGPAIDRLERRVGRVLYGGVPTGVEVSPAMVHGGPYPATTDARTTSVGSAAIDRFIRPFCWQDAPPSRLPAELQDANPEGLLRLVDGEWTRDRIRRPGTAE